MSSGFNVVSDITTASWWVVNVNKYLVQVTPSTFFRNGNSVVNFSLNMHFLFLSSLHPKGFIAI